MNEAKLLTLAAIAMFSACGSQDAPDGSEILPPPDYSVYPNLDKEPNNRESEARNIESGSNKITTGFTFTGSLVNDFEIDDDDIVTSITLDIDYYKFELKQGDIISITASNKSSPFSFKFYGPCYGDKSECTDKTVDVANKSNSLQDTIKTGHLQQGDILGTMVPFYIKVFSSPKAFEPYEPNPYIIAVKLLFRK